MSDEGGGHDQADSELCGGGRSCDGEAGVGSEAEGCPESELADRIDQESQKESGELGSACRSDLLELPVLPLRDIVIFPRMLVPLFVGRDKSVRALQDIETGSRRRIFLLTQRSPQEDIPSVDMLYTIGTLANVLQLFRLPDGTIKVLVEGVQRGRLVECTKSDPFLKARVEPIPEDKDESESKEVRDLQRALAARFSDYAKLNRKISQDVAVSIAQTEDADRFADSIAIYLNVRIDERQSILETLSVVERLKKVDGLMEAEINVLLIERKLRGHVKRQMEKTQREYYLNEQLKAIHKELGDDDARDELCEFEKKIAQLRAPRAVRCKFANEVSRLRHMSPMSAEASVIRGYLEWVTCIPWGETRNKIKVDLKRAQDILDRGHHGLDEVKERIVEHLAVQTRSKKIKGPILCLLGPPGVGKTSLGRSIAKATGREFVRLSLGGVHDEAEIRGHRRTYIGAMPGKIIQSMRRVKRTDPLFLLDEIDKLGSDFRGDPASAMLEVLDPEQNESFVDHYLEVEYDLSKVMFVATANTLDVPPALLDRLEIIRIAGYTEEEKVQICKQHTFEKILREHGMRAEEFSVSDEALVQLIRTYTREAGVRELERQVSKLARKSLRSILSKQITRVHITPSNLADFLGLPPYRHGEREERDQVGVVTGLAWTQVGGELLVIEAVTMSGKGNTVYTGNLKDVMKESISAASAYVRSRAARFGIEPPVFEKKDVHVHVPEGATPKDGPSAGVAMVTAIVSLLRGIPARADVAMTGEITLRGRVLPVGGLKEKLLAALRAGIRTVIVPRDNEREFSEVPEAVKDNLVVIFVSTIDEVLQHALTRKPEPIEWDGSVYVAPALSSEGSSPLVAH